MRRCTAMHFNPRIPRGMRLLSSYAVLFIRLFQSTHPSRDATGCIYGIFRPVQDFNPRIPRGMRQAVVMGYLDQCKISIHESLAGCDSANSLTGIDSVISIHASLAGCDGQTSYTWICERISIHASLAGCDEDRHNLHCRMDISIHASLAGCDYYFLPFVND